MSNIRRKYSLPNRKPSEALRTLWALIRSMDRRNPCALASIIYGSYPNPSVCTGYCKLYMEPDVCMHRRYFTERSDRAREICS